MVIVVNLGWFTDNDAAIGQRRVYRRVCHLSESRGLPLGYY